MSGGGGGKVEETEYQRAQTDVALRGWEDFKTRWKPAQNAYFGRVLSGYKGNRETAAGTAASDANVAFGDTARAVAQGQQRVGAGLGSGRSTAATMGADIALAKSRGLGVVSGKQAADDQHQASLGNIVATGRGEKAAATAGLSTLSNLSARTAANDAAIAAGNAQARGQFIGAIAGGALGEAANNFSPKPKMTSNEAMASWGKTGGDSWE
jgi:hypothetical protein